MAHPGQQSVFWPIPRPPRRPPDQALAPFGLRFAPRGGSGERRTGRRARARPTPRSGRCWPDQIRAPGPRPDPPCPVCVQGVLGMRRHLGNPCVAPSEAADIRRNPARSLRMPSQDPARLGRAGRVPCRRVAPRGRGPAAGRAAGQHRPFSSGGRRNSRCRPASRGSATTHEQTHDPTQHGRQADDADHQHGAALPAPTSSGRGDVRYAPPAVAVTAACPEGPGTMPETAARLPQRAAVQAAAACRKAAAAATGSG